jgi:hypothetical protein
MAADVATIPVVQRLGCNNLKTSQLWAIVNKTIAFFAAQGWHTQSGLKLGALQLGCRWAWRHLPGYADRVARHPQTAPAAMKSLLLDGVR